MTMSTARWLQAQLKVNQTTYRLSTWPNPTIIPFVELNSRLEELQKMKSDGLITESEYLALVDLARSQLPSNAEEPPAEVTPAENYLKTSKSRIAAGVVSLLVVGFIGFRLANSEDPMESKEYEKLLATKVDLTEKLSSLQEDLDSRPDLSTDIAVLVERIENWQQALNEIFGQGISS
jgi:hypothetical protein